MKRLTLLTAALLTLLCVPRAAHAAEGQTFELPFSFDKGYVTVKAHIKGDVPVEVLLSTGSEHSRIDSAQAEKHKLPGYYSAEAPIMGRNDRLYSFTTVPGVRVGTIKETSISMRYHSFEEVSKSLGREIFGVLGADFFKGRVVQFDFEKKVVRFLADSPPAAAKDATSADAARRARLPMLFYKERLTLPIVEGITFDGKKIKTLLDTGSVTVVSLSAASGKQLGLTPPAERGAPRRERVTAMRLGEHELSDVPVLLFPKGSGFELDEKEFGAVAGTILLQNFVVTFDFRDKVIVLEHR